MNDDLRQLLDGQRLGTAAKVDFFEEMTSLAFQAGARDQLETWQFALRGPGAVGEFPRIALVTAGKAAGLRAPYEVSLERAAASLRCHTFDMTPSQVAQLQQRLAIALRDQGIQAHVHKVSASDLANAAAWPRVEWILLRIPPGHGRPVIEGEWPLPTS